MTRASDPSTVCKVDPLVGLYEVRRHWCDIRRIKLSAVDNAIVGRLSTLFSKGAGAIPAGYHIGMCSFYAEHALIRLGQEGYVPLAIWIQSSIGRATGS